MPTPSERKTVQARILGYAEAVGWTFVSREDAEKRRAGFPTRRFGDGGQECPPSFSGGQECPPSFFDPYGEVTKTSHRLARSQGQPFSTKHVSRIDV